MALSDLAIRKAKPREKPYKMGDRDGLYLLISKSGSKLWRVNYTYNGRQKTFAIGKYPEISLAEAREKRQQVRRLLDDGIDPTHNKRSIRRANEAEVTFRECGEDFIDHLKALGRSEATVQKNEWMLGLTYTDLGAMPISAIQPADIRDTLLRIEASGRRETAGNVRGQIGRVFRRAIVNGYVDVDPTYSLKDVLTPAPVKSYAALTEPEDVGGLMRALDEYSGSFSVSSALQFLALTFVRPGEVRFARWSEIDSIGEVWRIPEERMKGPLDKRRPHDVPLSTQAVVLLNRVRRVRRVTGNSEFIFPSVRSSQRPLSENTLNAALRRMGYTKDEMTSHGFRSTASTILNERRFRYDVIEFQLAHVEPDKVRRVYNRAKYWDERVELMQAWADLLDSFRKL